MNMFKSSTRIALGMISLLWLGCEGDPRNAREVATPPVQNKSGQPAKAAEQPTKGEKKVADEPAATRKQIGRSLWLETAGKKRRVVVGAAVCLREASFGLECLMCRKGTKEHEALLATDANAEQIHAALLVAGAEPGSPVQYEEKDGKYKVIPPRGTQIKVTIEYEDGGKKVSVPAQKWVKNTKTGKDLESDWVFAGSKLFADPDDNKKTYYGANGDGAFICILNLQTALLDLPIDNPNRDPSEREYQPHTERMPPLDTKVMVILEAVDAKSKEKK
jgi:hypothetical protein